MAYCLNCRTRLDDDDVVCPFCGGRAGGRGRARELSDELTTDIRLVFRTQDETARMDPYDVHTGRALAALCYLFLPLLFILPAKKSSSAYIRFHAGQAFTLLLTAIFGGGGIALAGWVLRKIPLPVVGEVLFALLVALYGIFVLFEIVFGIRSALSGHARALPFIGSIRLLS